MTGESAKRGRGRPKKAGGGVKKASPKKAGKYCTYIKTCIVKW